MGSGKARINSVDLLEGRVLFDYGPMTNDNFADAKELVGQFATDAVDVTQATVERDEPAPFRWFGDIDSLPGGSVWWKWTAPTSGVVQLSTSGSNSAPSLGVYTGSTLTSLKEVIKDGANARFAAVAGVTYRIMAATYAMRMVLQDPVPAGTMIHLAQTQEAAPMSFAIARIAPALSTYEFTADDFRSSFSGELRSIVLTYTGGLLYQGEPVAAGKEIQLPATGSFGLTYAVPQRPGQRLSFSWVGGDGQRYSDMPASFTILPRNEAAPNDEMAGAIAIVPGMNVPVPLDRATSDGSDPDRQTYGGASLWYTWEAERDSLLYISAGYARVYRLTPDGLSEAVRSEATVGAKAGERFYIVVSGAPYFQTMTLTQTDALVLTGTAEADQIDVWRDGDTLIGTVNGTTRSSAGASALWIESFAGDDVIHLRGLLGRTLVFSGYGNDSIIGSLGADTIYAGGGDDSVLSGGGDDRVWAEAGQDTLGGETGVDALWGGVGLDVIYGGPDDDFLYGEDGSDWLFGGLGNDDIQGFDGRDWMFGESGDDLIYGSGGDDRLWGGDGADSVYGDDGNDTVDGGAGDDSVCGDRGDELIYVTLIRQQDPWTGGNDKLTGGDGNDKLLGGGGNDRIFADDGNDTVEGGFGDDTVLGAAGDDVLRGEAGSDWVFGGDGNDSLQAGGGNFGVIGWPGGTKDVLYGDADNDTLAADSGDDQLIGGAGNNTLLGAPGPLILIHGTDGPDLIEVSPVHMGAAVTVNGVQQFVPATTPISIASYGGDDRIVLRGGGMGTIVVYAGAGSDTVIGSMSQDQIHLGLGDDVAYAGDASDTVIGDGGNDTIAGEGGDDVLDGADGDDVLWGGPGNDLINGGTGSDVVDGGMGDDQLHLQDGQTDRYAGEAIAVLKDDSDVLV